MFVRQKYEIKLIFVRFFIETKQKGANRNNPEDEIIR